jgi:hypothetical protein
MGLALFGGNGKKPQVLKREELKVKKLSNLEKYTRVPVSF